MRQPPPLRFLLLVVGGWLCLRAAVYAPAWWIEAGVAAPAPTSPRATQAGAVAADGVRHRAVPAPLAPLRAHSAGFAPRIASYAARDGAPAMPVFFTEAAERLRPSRAAPAALPPQLLERTAPFARVAVAGRWSASAWGLLRRDGAPGLAPAGTLGGSQAGVRLRYRLNGDAARPLALSARLYAPLRDRRGGEAAVGIDWRPLGGAPVHILAERRQALGADGRSAFALTVYGGVDEVRLPGRLRLDAYGQAGAVGTRSPDFFADGSARISLPAGRLEFGAGAWGGAQRGAARLDAGPLVAIRLPGRTRVSAEWRFRIAGDAAPGSGPALTLGSDF